MPSSSINPGDTIKHTESGGVLQLQIAFSGNREGCSQRQLEISFAKQSEALCCAPCSEI